jgi:hypothetical protein
MALPNTSVRMSYFSSAGDGAKTPATKRFLSSIGMTGRLLNHETRDVIRRLHRTLGADS